VSLAEMLTTTTALLPLVLVYGQEGIGKSTFASRLPSPVLLRPEDGCPADVAMTAFPVPETFAQVREQLTMLATEPHDFRWAVLDSLDALEALIWRHGCQQHGWTSIEQPGFGKGYVVIDAIWHDFIAACDFLRRHRNMSVLLIAHSTIERIDDPRTASYTSFGLRVHKRARGIIQDNMDAIGFMAPDLVIQSEDAGFAKKRHRADGGSTRWLHWEARPSFVAKNRYGLPAKMLISKDLDFEKTLAPFFPAPR
jgi:AAA domain